MRWLLCDYGEVISSPQPAEDLDAMASLCGCDRSAFASKYWSHRPEYDRADLTAREYWQRVSGADVDQGRLDALVKLDVQSWLHPDAEVLAALLRAGERGFHLALLSNAPLDLADALDNVAWLVTITPKIFSCRVRFNKPDPAVYKIALESLGAASEDVVFIDDRAANVDAAREFGIQARLFTNVSQIDNL